MMRVAQSWHQRTKWQIKRKNLYRGVPWVPVVAMTIGLLTVGTPLPATADIHGVICASGIKYNPCDYKATEIMDIIAHPEVDTVVTSSHRGFHALVDGQFPGYVENNRGAILQAAAGFIPEIELDVKLSKDGVPVLSHDSTVGRSTNYGALRPDGRCDAGGCFDPFTDPDTSAKNPPINSLTANQYTALLARDSVSGVVNTNDPHPLTLQQALDIMTNNKVQMVLALDIREPAFATAALPILALTKDSRGNSYLDTTLFKVPFLETPTVDAVKKMFPANRSQVHYQPVFNTADACMPPQLQGGVCPGFNNAVDQADGEQKLLAALQTVERGAGVSIPAVEVQIHEQGKNMQKFLDGARYYAGGFHGRRSVTVFKPFKDIDPAKHDLDPSKEPYFFTTKGTCCNTLPSFYFRPSIDYTGRFGYDTTDQRVSDQFLIDRERFNGVTVDDAQNFFFYDTTNRDLADRLPSGAGGGTWAVAANRPLRAMVVGDSISHGQQGDHTWRYRLWDWLTSSSVSVDFVGPYKGTQQPAVAHAPVAPAVGGGSNNTDDGTAKTDGSYASDVKAGFESDHFAAWGRQAAQDKDRIYDVMSTLGQQSPSQMPDMLLVELGFNDVGWFVSDANGTMQSMDTFVQEARRANPDVAFVIANIPQRTTLGAGRADLPVKTRDYNAALPGQITKWNSSRSPVVMADFDGNYKCDYTASSCASTYDGLHPNELGEYRIARAFEVALHDGYGIGGQVPAAPATAPGRTLSKPATPSFDGTQQGLTATWPRVYGAYGYDVQWCDVTAGGSGCTPIDSSSNFNRWDKSWQFDAQPTPGHQYKVRVAARAGDVQNNGVLGPWSEWATGTADPHTATGPTSVTSKPTATGVDVTWKAPVNSNSGNYNGSIYRYGVWAYDKDNPVAFAKIIGFAGNGDSGVVNQGSIGDLVPGHHYAIVVEAWNAAGEGLPTTGRSVTINATIPGLPTDLNVDATPNGGSSVDLSWKPSAGASGYRIWRRDANTAGSALEADQVVIDNPAGATRITGGLAFQVPGVWNYQYCVTAINGTEYETTKNAVCVRPTKP